VRERDCQGEADGQAVDTSEEQQTEEDGDEQSAVEEQAA
jgi:hypothetical protein